MNTKEKSIDKIRENIYVIVLNTQVNKVRGGGRGSNISGIALGLTTSD